MLNHLMESPSTHWLFGVRNLLRRLANGDEARADDLAQATFIKAYQSIRAFRGGAKFTTWLNRIAQRLESV